jgi:hypothetical protein
MKKILFSTLVFLLLVISILPCMGNEFIPSGPTYEYYEDYDSFLEDRSIPDEYFIPWENFSSLGTLRRISYNQWAYHYKYFYHFQDANGIELQLFCDEVPYYVSKGFALDGLALDGIANLGKIDTGEGLYCLCINDAYYLYEDGDLERIVFQIVPADLTQYVRYDLCFCIKTSIKAQEYPSDEKHTLMARLLNPETASDAIDELRARLNGTYVEPWVLPTAICGGAVVLAGAATATAVAIRRKKRKVAVADTPAEEETA